LVVVEQVATQESEHKVQVQYLIATLQSVVVTAQHKLQTQLVATVAPVVVHRNTVQHLAVVLLHQVKALLVVHLMDKQAVVVAQALLVLTE
jgi:hypothetical protein